MVDNPSLCARDFVAYFDVCLQETRKKSTWDLVTWETKYLSPHLFLYLYLYSMSVFVSVFVSVFLFARHKGWCMVAGTCDLVTGELVSEPPRVIYRAALKSNLSSYCANLLLLPFIIYHLLFIVYNQAILNILIITLST